MRVTFEFDTDSENFDINELNRHYDADKMAYCLEELREKVKSLVKYSDKEIITIDELDDGFWEIIHDNDINFERLGY